MELLGESWLGGGTGSPAKDSSAVNCRWTSNVVVNPVLSTTVRPRTFERTLINSAMDTLPPCIRAADDDIPITTRPHGAGGHGGAPFRAKRRWRWWRWQRSVRPSSGGPFLVGRNTASFFGALQLNAALCNSELINREVSRFVMDPEFEPVFEQRLHHQAHLAVIWVAPGRCIDIIVGGINPGRPSHDLKEGFHGK